MDQPLTHAVRLDRRRFLLASLGAAGAVALGACSDDEAATPGDEDAEDSTASGALPSRPTLRLPGASFGFPSPFGYIGGAGYAQMSLIYDSLLWQDSTGELLPWLASGVERSDDGLTFTFELRDATWHDGQPVTAEDVAFTFSYFERAQSPLIIARPTGVSGVEATGDTTVEVRLERPLATFAAEVGAALPIIPEHVWSGIDDPDAVQDVEVLVGSGPYRLESINEAEGALAYAAFDDYVLGRPFVERIELVPTGDDVFTALVGGAVDAGGAVEVGGVRPETLAPFRGNEPYEIIDQPGGFTYPLTWNLDRGGALADVAFRQACAMAIDRDDIVDRVAGGNGLPGNPGFLPPSNPSYIDVEQYAFDTEAANELLDQAGYRRPGSGQTRQDPDGQPLAFELLFPNTLVALAELVVAGLERIGVEITPRAVELGPALFGAKLGANFDMIITLYPGPSGLGPNADPDLLRPIYASTPPTGFHYATGYTNAELNDLAERQQVTLDEAERQDLVARIQEIVAEDVPVLPLYYPTLFHVFDASVFDAWYWTPSGFPVGADNKQAYVTGSKEGVEVRPTR